MTVTANGTWFQSTHSLRSATFRKDDLQFIPSSFNPRTPCGVRQIRYYPDYQPQLFQSTHSLRSATNPASHHNPGSQVSIHALLAECDRVRISDPLCLMLFQSTHSLRSATCMVKFSTVVEKVSIHALLAECDQLGSEPWQTSSSFNPRTPCGVRQIDKSRILPILKFQSTEKGQYS